jgi:hypothetical protein
MDLFRYFHPHHHPRLRRVPLRLQELGELELAAKELSRALKRAEIRSENRFIGGPVSAEQIAEVVDSVDGVISQLKSLIHLHPGDSSEDMEKLIEERQSISGWENWARIVRERLNDSIILKKAAG